MNLLKLQMLFCLIFILMSCSNKQQKSTSTNLNMIIGTYTGTGSEGIYICSMDTVTGMYTILDSVKQENPSFMTLSDDNKFVYAVIENEDSTAGVTAYSFDNNKLTKLNSIDGLGSAPCNIATNGKEIVMAEYGGGSLTRYALNQDGSIGNLIKHTKFNGHSVDPNAQVSSHIHSAQYNEDGRLYISDLGSDNIYVQKGDRIIDSIKLEPNFGPRHFVFSKGNKMMYIIGELSGKVCVAERNDGKFIPVQYLFSDQTDGINGKGSADIHMSGDGKFLYTSNRLKNDGITVFSILPDGKLEMKGYVATGVHPRNFAITADDNWVVVACRDSNSIEFYKRDTKTGMLSQNKSFTINDIKMPVFVTFF